MTVAAVRRAAARQRLCTVLSCLVGDHGLPARDKTAAMGTRVR
jgi:hypothetical protein